ncbi:hypothetical protein [Nodosilinea sp. P-1105]|uniref:hypothetical protein n=1 Tax=Nodosilinea sp. P-1105 TaxID=2546229 RepID=UPI00146A5809|nr:hypothetical protein [Nodosilinea sp. P-1105]NMF82389.1 hypothetical protein [Nodosilinea sp. P-1105]
MIRRGLITGILVAILWLVSGLQLTAQALTPIELTDLSYQACPAEMADGMVVSGSIQEANCYLITGKAINRSGKPVVNADIFGRIYDANANPVMQNRTRLGSIDQVPPGESDFQLRVSVAANQPEPLRLEQFKASGFSGKVRR